MSTSPVDVKDILVLSIDFILSYSVTLAAIGTLSMALLEAFKSLFSWRDRWHRWKLCKWINNVELPMRIFDKINALLPLNESTFHHDVYSQLIELTTGQDVGIEEMKKGIEVLPWDISESNALFTLDLEKLMGQIQDAADMTLSYPQQYKELYLFLTAGANENDIVKWFQWAHLPPISITEDPKEAKDQSDTYSRLRQFIRRRLDAFQLSTSYQWQTGNQIVSVVLGAILLFASLIYLNDENPNFFELIAISTLGGVMAPVMKDLVKNLKKVRSDV